MNGDSYVGEFKKNFESGQGIKTFAEHSQYKEISGVFDQGKPHGKCIVKL